MISIDDAIKRSKTLPNIGNGGSACYDLGDVVLVKYVCPIKYFRNDKRTREKSEEIMESLNEKIDKYHVNTPRHLTIKRAIEEKNDVCYVLQEKSKGFNLASRFKYHDTTENICSSLEFILKIPSKQYEKLILDGLRLFEMGFEGKNKNLFYDSETGFWYIDFLSNDEDYQFDFTDPKKIFEALKYRVPKPVNMAPTVNYDETLSESETKRIKELQYKIKAKTLLVIKRTIPLFSKYEKMFLLNEEVDYRKYLMDEKIVDDDLFSINGNDYTIYNELYEIVIKGLIDKIMSGDYAFWQIESNEIRIDSDIFNIQKFYMYHKDNYLSRFDYDSDYEYEYDTSMLYKISVMKDLIERLKDIDNVNIQTFISEVNKYLEDFDIKVK